VTLLSVQDLTVIRGGCPVVDRVSFTVEATEIVGLIGSNGAGKTSLMRGVLGLLPARGQSDLARLPPRDRARRAAWMPQSREIAWPVTVETLVTLGRIPHLPASPQDRTAVDHALARLDLAAFRDRIATELSGGEQARVLLARVLAQETPLILADEPIAGLDPAHQIATMEVFRDVARDGRAVLVSLHDLGLAARHCTRLLLMDRGRLVADGTPAEVLTEANLRAHFHVRAHLIDTAEGPVFQLLERVA
jgi:iron complex transport system ATP-binding protein